MKQEPLKPDQSATQPGGRTVDQELSIAQQLELENARATKLNVLIDALNTIAPESLDLSETSIRLYKQLMAQLSYQEFLYLPPKKANSAPITVLGINNTPPTDSFTYTEKKALQRACFETAIKRILQPPITFMSTKRKQSQFNVFELAQLQKDIVVEAQRLHQLQHDLVHATLDRLRLLQEAAEIKAGPELANELNEMLLRITLCSEKSSLLIQMLNREFCFRTDHAIKAIKQIDGFLDASIETYQK